MISDVITVVRPLFMFNIKTRNLYDKNRLIDHNQTNLQHFFAKLTKHRIFTATNWSCIQYLCMRFCIYDLYD